MAQTLIVSEETSVASYAEPTGWTGWAAFAGVMMVLAGVMQACYGLVAIFNDNWVVFGNQANLYLDLTAWGWVHLILGAVVVLAGIGVFLGNALARAVGVIIAGLSLIASFLFIPAYPVWALVVIAVDVLVIYALIAHGREMRSLSL
jgi:hypothetical protein